MKGKLKNIIGVILISVGVIIIISALYMKMTANYKQKKMIRDFKKTIEKVDKGDNDSKNAVTQNVKSGTIGIMYIPKINLQVAVSEGTDMKTLKYAVGHFSGTALPGKRGNSCFAGHRSYTYGEYFNRLDELKIGDLITIETKDGKYAYKVNKINVVNPSDTYVLDQTNDSEITLVTCTPIRIATHRLIVKGVLVK